jgi:thioredoxin 1
MNHLYETSEPSLAEVETWKGATVIEFGTPWCGYCRSVQPLLADAFANHSSVKHVKIEDGSGRALGRNFRVKLWPTLIFLQDGREVERLVRPANAELIRDALVRIDTRV